MEKGFKISKIVSFLIVFLCMAALTFTVFAAGKEGVVKGKTTQDPLTPPYIDEGVLDFDVTARDRRFYPYTAWLQKLPSGSYLMRGWVWNQNLGWISMYCKDGKNDGRPCGSTNYGVNIASNGSLFRGFAWGDNVGWISFECSGGANGGYVCDNQAPIIDYHLKLDTTDPNGDGFVEVTGTSKYAWADSAGWINFSGVKFPWFECNDSDFESGGVCYDKDKDGCVPGASRWTPSGQYLCGSDCNDNDATMFPGAPEICTDNKDNDCDGKTDCTDENCSEYPACTGAPPAGPPVTPGGGCGGCGGGIPPACDPGLCDNVPPISNPVTSSALDTYLPDFGSDNPVNLKIRGSITSEYFGLTNNEYQSVGAQTASSKAVRTQIYKNILGLTRGVTPDSPTKIVDENLFSDVKNQKSRDFVYLKSGTNSGYHPTISDNGLDLNYNIFTTPKTLIVVGDDLIIRGNIYGEAGTAGRLGIIVLKNLNTGRGGNIYVDKDVTNIQANIYADGTVFAYDPGHSAIYDQYDNYLLGIGGLNGQPLWEGDYDPVNADDEPVDGGWRSQLCIQGSITSSNTLGAAGDNGGKLPNGNSTTSPNQAKLYDLEYLRFTPPLVSSQEPCKTDESNTAIVIYYVAPQGIPGFDALGTAASGSGGY